MVGCVWGRGRLNHRTPASVKKPRVVNNCASTPTPPPPHTPPCPPVHPHSKMPAPSRHTSWLKAAPSPSYFFLLPGPPFPSHPRPHPHPKMPAPSRHAMAFSATLRALAATLSCTSAGASVTWQMLSLCTVSTRG